MRAQASRRLVAVTRSGKGRPRGFVLPFVVIAISAVSLMAFAFTAEGLQSVRGQRGAARGADASAAADAALAQALASYAPDSVWHRAPGALHTRSVTINGASVELRWQRHQPLMATLRALAQTSGGQRSDDVVREHYRAVWLEPPAVPIVAQLASNGPVSGREGSLLSGSDGVLPGSPCGIARDTMSVETITAPAVRAAIPGGWPGAPVAAAPYPDLHRELMRALDVIGTRAPARTTGAAPLPFPASPDWTALHLRGDTIAIAGPTEWKGLLVARGRLVVTGVVRVTGLLIVEGLLDASAAQLSVQGAVIAADTSASGVMLGAQSRLFYDRCAVQMALATVARPSLAPFSLWHKLPR